MTYKDNKNLMNAEYLDSTQQDTIYILAPGPNGIDHWDKIPQDAMVICVNKAIELIHSRQVKCGSALWIVSEAAVIQTEWFAIHREAYKDILCVGQTLTTIGGMKEDEYFKYFNYHGRADVGEIIDVVPGALSIGTTVSGMAMQLAWHMGSKHIILCGVDMEGEYYDGTERTGGTAWNMYVERLDRLMSRMKEKRDIEIVSLSPTRLNVETNNKPVNRHEEYKLWHQ